MASMRNAVAICLIVALTTSAMTSSPFAAAADTKQMIRITTIPQPPYVYHRPAYQPSNADFEGYIPDLVEKLANHLNFDYQLTVVADGKYGSQLSDGRWTGMIGELVTGKADLAAAALTLTTARWRVVEFTNPFMTFDRAILMKKRTGTETRPLPQIRSIRDLANQTVIKYGVMFDGATGQYFRNSIDPAYMTMWSEMFQDRRISNVNDISEGVRRVRESVNGRPYAFILEGPIAEYIRSQPPCDLVDIPGHMDKTGYALALRLGVGLQSRLNDGLAYLERTGQLDALRRKWWTDRAICSGAALGVGPLGAILVLPVVLLASLRMSA